MALTIDIRSKKAMPILKSLEETEMIRIVTDPIPAHWSAKKRRRAQDFLDAYKEAKEAAEGKIELKSAQSLIDEL